MNKRPAPVQALQSVLSIVIKRSPDSELWATHDELWIVVDPSLFTTTETDAMEALGFEADIMPCGGRGLVRVCR